jgi:hypothetical protein
MSKIKCLGAWFLVWPDGAVHPSWGYASVRDLKEQAPGLVTGLVKTWDELAQQGYRYVRCMVVPTAEVKK